MISNDIKSLILALWVSKFITGVLFLTILHDGSEFTSPRVSVHISHDFSRKVDVYVESHFEP